MKKVYFLLLALFLHQFLIAQGIYQLWGTTDFGGSDDAGTLFSTRFDGSLQKMRNAFAVAYPGFEPRNQHPVVYNNKLYTTIRKGGLKDQGILVEYDPATGVYTKRADFSSIGGTEPTGGLVVYNNRLYGLCRNGGAHDRGLLFEYNPVNKGLTKEWDFVEATGANPSGSLVVYDNKLYGFTQWGGTSNDGVLFSYDPLTNGYAKRIDLTDGAGRPDNNGLTVYSNRLWGFTQGGQDNKGALVEYNPATNVLLKKADIGTIDGNQPQGAPALYNGRFYGHTYYGGPTNQGMLFEYNIATQTLQHKLDYTVANGGKGEGSLLLYSSRFYGITAIGGSGGGGVLFEYNPATNAFVKKQELDNSTGRTPVGGLVFFEGSLYGLTNTGGAHQRGVLFAYEVATDSYATKVELGTTSGIRPIGRMTEYGGKLYGMTAEGGLSGRGTIYRYEPGTQVYTDVAHFSESHGYSLNQAGLCFLAGSFYGVHMYGGPGGEGTLFAFDPQTKQLTVKHHFSVASGGKPVGPLVVLNNKLYGITQGGGANGSGVVFEYDPATAQYMVKVVLSDNWGRNAQAGLTAYNNRIYGVTTNGGTYDHGTLFEYNPAANSFAKRYDFNGTTEGAEHWSALVGMNGQLYGMAMDGGAHDYGVLYAYDPATHQLTVRHAFNYATGAEAISTLTALNGRLYGLTRVGGDAAAGVLFEFHPAASSYTVKQEFTIANGARPRSVQMQPVMAPVAPGSAGSCINAGTVLVNTTNSMEWIPFADAEGNAVMEINPNGNILGQVVVRLYVHDGDTRKDAQGRYYLDRNVTVEVANQPTTPVSVRLYVRRSEYESLKNTAGVTLAGIEDVRLYKTGDACGAAIGAAGEVLTGTVGNWGTDYVFSTEAASFSSFYFSAASSATLPVHILSFKGQRQGNVNKLEWKADCTNDVDFIIERSSNGMHFEQVGLVWATQASCGTPFSFIDDKAPAGQCYYRLKMKEDHGAISFSRIVLIGGEAGAIHAAKLFPNPVFGSRATLQVTARQKGQVQLSISDMAGRVLLSAYVQVNEGLNNVPLNVQSLAAGLYQVLYIDGERREVIRFVKQ